MFNAYCLSVTLGGDVCVFCSQTHPKCLGKVLGTQQVINISIMNGLFDCEGHDPSTV